MVLYRKKISRRRRGGSVQGNLKTVETAKTLYRKNSFRRRRDIFLPGGGIFVRKNHFSDRKTTVLYNPASDLSKTRQFRTKTPLPTPFSRLKPNKHGPFDHFAVRGKKRWISQIKLWHTRRTRSTSRLMIIRRFGSH